MRALLIVMLTWRTRTKASEMLRLRLSMIMLLPRHRLGRMKAMTFGVGVMTGALAGVVTLRFTRGVPGMLPKTCRSLQMLSTWFRIG